MEQPEYQINGVPVSANVYALQAGLLDPPEGPFGTQISFKQPTYQGLDGRTYIDASTMINDDKGASKVAGKLRRAQWNDWLARYEPRLQQLSDYAASGSLTKRNTNRAGDAIHNAYRNARTSQRLQNESFGIQQNAAQRQASQRRLGLTEAAATASARNQARMSGQDRDMQILAGNAGLKSDLQKTQQQY